MFARKTWVCVIDMILGVQLKLESSAKYVTADFVHVMENLRNSLHPVSKK